MPESPDSRASRRTFLKVAGSLAATAATAATGAAAACAPNGSDAPSDSAAKPSRGATELDRRTLGALAEVVLPSAIGAAGQAQAVDAFVAWVDGYDPVAEEMHGYGYADVRYLPADPAPAWRAQLDGLDLLARKTQRTPFAECDAAARLSVVTAALASVRGARIPDPLGAPHVAVALLSHWTGSPAARDLAFGVQIGAGTCRSLDAVTAKPLPLAGRTA